MQKNKAKQEPFTLETLADYNQQTLFPALEELLVTKQEFNDFKNKSFANDDKMFKKLDIILDEMKAGRHGEKKEDKLWAIVINSLKEHKILSSKELEEIAGLEIF